MGPLQSASAAVLFCGVWVPPVAGEWLCPRGGAAAGGPGPSPGEGDFGGYHPPGAAAAGAWAFSGESPDERAPWGAAPWTPARRRRFLPRDPLLWFVQTLRGAFLPPWTGLRPAQRQAPEGCRPPGGRRRRMVPFGWGRERASALCGHNCHWTKLYLRWSELSLR